MTPNRAFVLSIPVLLAVEAGIFYGLAGLGVGGRAVVAVEMLWLVVAVFLNGLFMHRYEHEGRDDSAD